MNFLDISIYIFVFLELSNIIIIYMKPDFKYGNGLAVFKDWNQEQDESTMLFKKYMANWVAGSKLIFVVLLIVIVVYGNDTIKLASLLVMIPAIATYYIKLHPLIKKLDSLGRVQPKGYANTLIAMISTFLLMFVVAICLYLIG